MTDILSQRLSAMDAEGECYELDFVTMKSGFVYRRAAVLKHDQAGILISTDRHPEVYLAMSEIASANIIRM